VLRSNAAVEPRFLFRYVLTDQFLDRVTPQQTGTHYPATSDKVVMSEAIPLAPLAEQRRIVAKLEKLLGQVDACQQRLEKMPTLLKRFRQSILAAACSGRLTADWRKGDDGQDELPRSWELVEFGSLIAKGPNNGLYKPQSCYGSGTPIVRIDAFYDGKISNWSELKRLQLSKQEREQFALADGDILINRVNSPKFLGKCAIVRAMPEPSVYESNMMRLQLDAVRANSDYAILYLRSSQGLVELRKNAKHAVNQSSINQDDVKSVLFALPPLAEQQEIVRRVAGLFALADQLEQRLALARKQVDKLTPSLLARAFAGQLVPQNPTDEPAEKLLARVRQTVKL
jgi:type I restriction enzyme S subunit